jgi:hypothetical protein
MRNRAPGLSAVMARMPSQLKEICMKLNDTELTILSTAARRQDRGIKFSSDLTPAAAEKLAAKLAGAGLIEEVETKGNLPVWRTVEDQRYSLHITNKGLEASGGASKSVPATSDAKPTKPTHPRRPLTQNPKAVSRKQKVPERAKVSQRPSRQLRSEKSAELKPPKKGHLQGPGTKLAKILDLLSRKRGATIEEMIQATGWQAHSVRGAMSGAIKKKLGHKIISEKHGDTRRYRIESGTRS